MNKKLVKKALLISPLLVLVCVSTHSHFANKKIINNNQLITVGHRIENGFTFWNFESDESYWHEDYLEFSVNYKTDNPKIIQVNLDDDEGSGHDGGWSTNSVKWDLSCSDTYNLSSKNGKAYIKCDLNQMDTDGGWQFFICSAWTNSDWFKVGDVYFPSDPNRDKH